MMQHWGENAGRAPAREKFVGLAASAFRPCSMGNALWWLYQWLT